VERITKFTASFAEHQQCVQPAQESINECAHRSIAGMTNAGGANLRHSVDAISSSTLAARFMEVFQGEAESVKPEKTTYCVLHKQSQYLNVEHDHPIITIGYSLSEYSCPRDTQLVVSLLKALVSGLDKFRIGLHGWPLMDEVCILCSILSPF
jgi:hypothetical protein